MSDPKLDQRLADYLEQIEGERAQGITLEAIMLAVKRVTDDRLRDRAQDKRRFEALEATDQRHGRRIGALERHMMVVSSAPPMTDVPNYHVDPSEITGTHQFQTVMAAHKAATKADELEERLDEEEQNRTFWKRQGVLWAVAALGFVIAMFLTACSTIAVTRLFPPPTPIAPATAAK